ncbi:MAG: enoyl-CoA hydratase-related protein [Candidatus Bathyarchaeia archaeon]|jgi:enoyl-CoA hydratase
MSFKDLIVDREDKILLVKINRPDVLNALRRETFLELEQTLTDFSSIDEMRVMIITGEGERAFSAGGDVRALLGMNSNDAASFASMTHRILDKMERMPKPVIAAVNGLALGAGCDLAIACDIVLASEKALFGEPPTGLGITTPFGGTQRLPRIVGPKRAKQLFFTGESIDAEMALKFGLVNKVVKHEELISEARKFAGKILERAPLAVGYCKRLVNFSSYGSLEEGDKLEAELYARCFDTEDKTEGMRAFLEKRKPTFKGK